MRKWNVLLACSLLLVKMSVGFADLSGSLTEKSITERLAPVGSVTIQTGGEVILPANNAAVDIGQKRYEETCHICHGSGLAGSPKFGDKAEWAPRISEGIETLVKHAIQGYKTMPPKGTCMNCSDEEIQKAVEYMIDHSK